MGMGGSDSNNKQARKTARLQRGYAQKLWKGTQPIRRDLFDRSTQFLEGGMDVRETPTWEALKYNTDASFNRAKDNMIGRFAPGGGLVAALSGLEGERAGTMAQGAASIYENELARAMMLGTGMAQTAFGGLGQAGQMQAQLAQASAAENAAGKGALGTAAGMGLGGWLGNK